MAKLEAERSSFGGVDGRSKFRRRRVVRPLYVRCTSVVCPLYVRCTRCTSIFIVNDSMRRAEAPASSLEIAETASWLADRFFQEAWKVLPDDAAVLNGRIKRPY